jgi:hypothetical protein
VAIEVEAITVRVGYNGRASLTVFESITAAISFLSGGELWTDGLSDSRSV